MIECKSHRELEKKIDRIAESQAEMVGLLREAVVKKDEFYEEIISWNDKLNDVRDQNKKHIGIVIGVLVPLGSAIGILIKNL
jgi:hypothetical protein